MKTGSESMDAITRRRWILDAGFVTSIEDARLPNCVISEGLMGSAGCVGGQEKGWMGCILGDLKAFGINADQRTTVAHDEGEWHKAEEQGAERFMAKWVAAGKARAGDYGMQLDVSERGGNGQREGESPKKACLSWFAFPEYYAPLSFFRRVRCFFRFFFFFFFLPCDHDGL